MRFLFLKLKDQKFKLLLLTFMYTVLFGVILVLIVTCASLADQTTFIESYVENEVTILSKYKPLYEDTANEIKKLKCVNEYNVMCFNSVLLENSLPVIKDRSLYDQYVAQKTEEMPKLWNEEFDPEDADQARIIETNSTKNSSFFLTKGFHITEGRHIRDGDKNSALVSEEFAEENNLHVGDYVETKTSKADQSYYSHALDMKLKIVGIFTHSNAVFQGDPKEYESNYIFTSLGPVSQMYIAAYHRMTVYLKPGYSISDLKQQLSEGSLYIDPDNYTFSSSNEWASIFSEPLTNMQDMSRSLLIFMVLCVLVIILLIGAFYIRENWHNTGILLSIGTSRGRVILRMLAEEYVPLLAGALLALLIGICGAGHITQFIDSRYTAQTQKIIAEKNDDLTSKLGSLDSYTELQIQGQVMRMESDFKTGYSLNWHVLAVFFGIICIFFPVCLWLQVLVKIKRCSIRQILLS